MGVKQLFRHGAVRFPERTCLDDGRVALTCRDVALARARIAGVLRAQRIAPGAGRALLSANCTMAMVALLAIYEADSLFVPLDTAMPVAEHQIAVADLAVEVLFYHSKFAAAAADILATYQSLQWVPSARRSRSGSSLTCHARRWGRSISLRCGPLTERDARDMAEPGDLVKDKLGREDKPAPDLERGYPQ